MDRIVFLCFLLAASAVSACGKAPSGNADETEVSARCEKMRDSGQDGQMESMEEDDQGTIHF